jgi:hypothetical protein
MHPPLVEGGCLVVPGQKEAQQNAARGRLTTMLARFAPLPNSPNGEIVLVGGPLPPGDTFNVIYGVGTPAAMTVDVTFTPLSVPEPSSLVLLGVATTVGAIVIYTRRRRLRAAESLTGL